MRLRSILSRTFKGLFSNRAMAAALALVTFVSLLFAGAALLFHEQISNLKDQWYDKVEVSVFMCPISSDSANCSAGEATQEEIDAIAGFLGSQEMARFIDTVSFETKAQALENYREQMEDKAWAAALTEDEMQVSYRIKLSDPTQYQVVAEAVSGRPGVEVVVDQRQQLEPVFSVLNKLIAISWAIAGVMIVTAVLLIPTTIRLSAMSRKDETQIMRYVGASNSFIEIPFILEGVISALVGSLLAVGGLWAILRFFIQDWFASAMQWMNIVNVRDVYELAPFLILGAIALSALMSWIALRRHVRV